MVDDGDGGQVVASLTGRLHQLSFVDITADRVTARVIEAVADWAAGQGWRVYRRARSVLPLPAPMSGQFSIIDVACARPDAPPVVVEVDRTDRARTAEKLVAEAAAGRVAIWVRWGTGPFGAPPPAVHLVTCAVTHRNGSAGQGRLYTRRPDTDRPPPAHSSGPGTADVVELPIPLDDPGTS
ncbi:hypothetical protein GCM10009779_01500 [Polymorphospora rubra]|uniref:Uncharacterized protein n=1 Tax=Polymorphospora rubra TaxID=338584 RepID=A0A810MYZ3_9ACTN|nr:hypothetical protein Prubr_28310 [Polymorphospora rubra]